MWMDVNVVTEISDLSSEMEMTGHGRRFRAC